MVAAALHGRDACLLVDAAVVIGRGLLATLLAPLLATSGTLLDILGDEVG
jgi:hypothetical protein